MVIQRSSGWVDALPKPPLVAQEEAWDCWAAALSSWLRATRSVYFTREQLVERSQRIKGFIGGGPQMSSDPRLFINLINTAEMQPIGMMTKTWDREPPTAMEFCQMIEESQYLFLGYKNAAAGHAVVVHGAHTGGALKVMNPGTGREPWRAFYKQYSIDDFKVPLLIGYKIMFSHGSQLEQG